MKRNPSHSVHFFPSRFLFDLTICFPAMLKAAELPTKIREAVAIVPKNDERTCLAAF